MPEPLFPQLPEDLATLTDDELAANINASMEAKDRIRAQDAEFLGDLTANEILDTMKAGVAGILALKAEQATREQAAANLQAELDAQDALVAEPEPVDTLAADTPDEPADEPADLEPVAAVAEPEPVVAAAEPEKPPLRRLPAAGRHAAVPIRAAAERGPRFTAAVAAEAEGVRSGTEFDLHDGLTASMSLNMALGKAVQRARGSSPHDPGTVTIATADITGEIPEFRRLRGDNSDREKVDALVAAAKSGGVGVPDGMDWDQAEALTASGGICAPVTPYYQLAFISEMARPVRDSLVGFIADRGGITFAPPPYLSEITTGVGVITASQDAAGGTAGTKTCQTLICPGFLTVEVNSIFHCFQGGNLGQRAFPEQASQFSSLILAQHARVAETQLLNAIKAGSTQVLGQSTVLGSISSLLNDVVTAAAAYRSNNRMARNAPLQVILPQWTADNLVIDLIQSQFQRFSMDQAGLEALFAALNIRVTWTMDGPTDGEGQVLPRQTAGALDGFPTVVEYPMFHPGAWLFVDSGVLELGIVRDSALNATNSYQVFGESWEAAAGIGVQSLWVTSNICPTGATALSISNIHQCGS